jgi:uncharacterized alpha/beta hydrolase family protein
LKKKNLTIVLVIIGIIIIGITASFSFNSNDQKPTITGTNTVEWRHVHGLGIDPNDSNILYIATHGDFYQSKSAALPVKVDKIRADYMAFNAPPSVLLINPVFPPVDGCPLA